MSVFGEKEGYKPLPATRFKSFFFYSRDYFIKIVLFGVISALFFVPALIWLYACHYSGAQAAAALNSNAADYKLQITSLQIGLALTQYSVLIPFICLFFVGLAGAFSAAKTISCGQFCTVGCYFKGIAQNWPRFLLCGLVFGISLFFLNFGLVAYPAAQNKLLSALFSGISLLQFILVAMFSIWFCTQQALYTATLKQILFNSVRLTFAKFLPTLPVVLCVALPYMAMLFIPSPFQLLGLLVLMFFYIGFASLGITCYTNYIYDKTINPVLGEQFVGRGLEKTKR